MPGVPPLKVLTINHHGAGFADFVELDEGSTLRQLLRQQISDAPLEDFVIRVNLRRVPPDETLRDGDRVTITPL